MRDQLPGVQGGVGGRGGERVAVVIVQDGGFVGGLVWLARGGQQQGDDIMDIYIICSTLESTVKGKYAERVR